MTQIDSANILLYVDALLKHGNYTKAAKELYISQPYLTQTIKRIEKELGTEILNRSASPLQLTDAGSIYYNYLVALETQKENLFSRIAQYSTPDIHIIRIGVLSSLGTYLLPLVLPPFQKKYPNVKFDIYEAIPKISEESVLNGKLDFYLGQNPEKASPNLTIYEWGKHGYYAVIPSSSRFYQKNQHTLKNGSLSIKELLNEPFILTKKGSAIRRQVDQLFLKYKVHPKVVVESNNIFTVLQMAKNGLGVSLIPSSVQLPDFNGNYNIYHLPFHLISVDYFIAHSKNKTLLPAEKDLINVFLTCLDKANKVSSKADS